MVFSLQNMPTYHYISAQVPKQDSSKHNCLSFLVKSHNNLPQNAFLDTGATPTPAEYFAYISGNDYSPVVIFIQFD
jgi:hypothetical protein